MAPSSTYPVFYSQDSITLFCLVVNVDTHANQKSWRKLHPLQIIHSWREKIFSIAINWSHVCTEMNLNLKSSYCSDLSISFCFLITSLFCDWKLRTPKNCGKFIIVFDCSALIVSYCLHRIVTSCDVLTFYFTSVNDLSTHQGKNQTNTNWLTLNIYVKQ